MLLLPVRTPMWQATPRAMWGRNDAIARRHGWAGARYGTISTGQGAACSTCWLTLPTSNSRV